MSFEFGTTPPPRGPFDDWERALLEQPDADQEEEQAEPARCENECCVPQPDGGGLL